MFGRPRRAQGDGERREPFTYVHRGTTVVGELDAEGRVRVHGTVRGNVRVRGVLEVAEAGVVEGDRIDADEVKILGRVVATVHARGKVEIWKGGELVGDVRAASLDIEEGARFTGRSEMMADGEASTPRRPTTRGLADRARADRDPRAAAPVVGDVAEAGHGAADGDGDGSGDGKGDAGMALPERSPEVDAASVVVPGVPSDRSS